MFPYASIPATAARSVATAGAMQQCSGFFCTGLPTRLRRGISSKQGQQGCVWAVRRVVWRQDSG
jgi:hypothetical protein